MINTRDEGGILALNYPKVAEEWNYEKNGALTPWMVTDRTSRKVWWICSRGHEWEAGIYNRTQRQSGCPYCTHRKLLTGFNDMATTNPEMAAEWDFEKNGEMSPRDVFAHSASKAWWICPKGHPSFYMKIASKSFGQGCPVCGKEKSSRARNKAVSQFSREGELIQSFPSVKAAGEENGRAVSAITRACRGRVKSRGEYVYRYAAQPTEKQKPETGLNAVKLLDALDQEISVADEVMFIRHVSHQKTVLVRGTVGRVTGRSAFIHIWSGETCRITASEVNPVRLSKVLVMKTRPERIIEETVDASGYPIREGDSVAYTAQIESNSCKGFKFGVVKKFANDLWEINGTQILSERLVVLTEVC